MCTRTPEDRTPADIVFDATTAASTDIGTGFSTSTSSSPRDNGGSNSGGHFVATTHSISQARWRHGSDY